MRGGTQLRMEKEGMERSVSRSMVEKTGTCSRMTDDKKETSKPRNVKEVECVVFVLATPGSKLRDILQ